MQLVSFFTAGLWSTSHAKPTRIEPGGREHLGPAVLAFAICSDSKHRSLARIEEALYGRSTLHRLYLFRRENVTSPWLP
jgi:hypothetical protein